MDGKNKLEATSLPELPRNVDAFVARLRLSEEERQWLLNIKVAVENEHREEWELEFLKARKWYEENYLPGGGRLPNKNIMALEALITVAEMNNVRDVEFKGTAHLHSAVSSEIARLSDISD